jgi:hypothetical protein
MILSTAITGLDFLQEGLRPLEYLDISKLYESYSVFIDFAIYLMVFVGISQITLGSRFQGKGGKAITIAIGISLALALAISERYLGFSLRSLGPIAVGIFLAILSVMIYRLIKQLGGDFAVSGSLAYIIILLFLTATMPSFFAWINKNTPLLGLGLVIGFFWAAYKVISHLFRGKKLSEKLGEKFKEAKTESDAEITQMNRSKGFQRSQIKPITKQAFKTSDQILNELAEILKSIEKYGHLPEARAEIKKQIDKIMPEQMELMETLKTLQTRHGKILAFDMGVYSQEFQKLYRELSGPEKAAMKRELEDEYVKLGIEKQLPVLERQIQDYQVGIRNYLNQASSSLMAGDIENAKSCLKKAINLEQETKSILGRLRNLEKQIFKHTKREISMERRLQAVGAY